MNKTQEVVSTAKERSDVLLQDPALHKIFETLPHQVREVISQAIELGDTDLARRLVTKFADPVTWRTRVEDIPRDWRACRTPRGSSTGHLTPYLPPPDEPYEVLIDPREDSDGEKFWNSTVSARS